MSSEASLNDRNKTMKVGSRILCYRYTLNVVGSVRPITQNTFYQFVHCFPHIGNIFSLPGTHGNNMCNGVELYFHCDCRLQIFVNSRITFTKDPLSLLSWSYLEP